MPALSSLRRARSVLRAQLWTNADTQPIEDASVEWPTEESPCVTVATIRIPVQDALRAGDRTRRIGPPAGSVPGS